MSKTNYKIGFHKWFKPIVIILRKLQKDINYRNEYKTVKHLSQYYARPGGGGDTGGIRQTYLPDRREFDNLLVSENRLWSVERPGNCYVIMYCTGSTGMAVRMLSHFRISNI